MAGTLMDSEWYWEVIGNCEQSQFEMLSYHLFERGATGVEELSCHKNKVEFKVFFTSDQPNLGAILELLKQENVLDIPGIHFQLPEKRRMENWQANWKKHFKPIKIGKNFLVIPAWEKVTSPRKKIVIQPGFGFGTGYHESTNLALQLLEAEFENHNPEEVLDVGTGSGILSIAACLLGAKTIHAIDIDQDALAEVANNFNLSGLDPTVCQLVLSDPAVLELEPRDLVMANIEDHILVTMVESLLRLTKKDGSILLSGILTERQPILMERFGVSVELMMRVELNEWTGMLLRKL